MLIRASLTPCAFREGAVVEADSKHPIAFLASVESGRHRQKTGLYGQSADPITAGSFWTVLISPYDSAVRPSLPLSVKQNRTMLSTIQIAVVAAACVHTASAYSSYMELIPNGENIGKTLGHTDSGYTDFGTLFSDGGTEWSKVCSETWPGGSVTCGQALGDPCCTWKSGDPDYQLTEPNTDGTTCASSSTATSGAATSTAASTAASGAAETTAASGTTDDAATQASNTTDSTAAVTDSSEYCE